MADYQKMYSLLFNEVTDTIEDLDAYIEGARELRERLAKIQQRCEEIYEKSNEEIIKMRLVKPANNEGSK